MSYVERRLELLRRVRRLSALRIAAHGPLPESSAAWWRQVAELAAEHGIALPTPEEWAESGTKIEAQGTLL